MDKLKAGVIGATGYAGFELVRLLLAHPEVELKSVSSVSYKGERISDIYPQLTGICDLVLIDDEEVTSDCDIIFASLPAGHSEPMAKKCFESGKLFIDMGADFRLKDEKDYTEWYGGHYSEKELHEAAVYSIPELHRRLLKNIKDTKDVKNTKGIENIKESEEAESLSHKKGIIIANPGCYVTSICLGLYPAIAAGAVDTESIIADSKSGATGAGRGLALNTHFTECNEAFSPYKTACHRHTPEIEQVLNEISGKSFKLTFVPHLLPANRGIESTIYASFKEGFDFLKVREIYEKAYGEEKFVKILPDGMTANIKNIKYSNFCHISLHEDKRTGRLIIVSVLDNMVKGAAGQAVQNMNIACGFEEDTALCMIPPAF